MSLNFQLVATFSLSTETFREHRNGDGMSGSSGGSPSPEFVRVCKKDVEESFEAVITSQDIHSRGFTFWLYYVRLRLLWISDEPFFNFIYLFTMIKIISNYN